MTIQAITGLIFLVLMLGVVLLGIHVAWALGLLGIIGMVLIAGPQMAANQLGNMPYNLIGDYSMATVPLFIFMGIIAEQGGIATDAFIAARLWIGRLRGGLAIATTAAAAMFAAVTGSTMASSALFAKIAYPEMAKQGYDKKLATGCIIAVGTIAAMIPPSILLVLYGIVAGVSIGKLLVGGIIPGILNAVTFMIYIYVYARVKPNAAPLVVFEKKVTWMDRLRVTTGIVPIAFIFIAVIGGMFTGIFTPTEGAAIGACITLLVVLSMRRVKAKGFITALKQTIITSVGLKLIIVGGYFFSRMMVTSGSMKEITTGLLALPIPSIGIMFLLFVLLFIAGMAMVPIVMLVIFVPMMLPALVQMGYDPVWFGIMFVTMCEIADITPPVALNLFVVKAALGDAVDTIDMIKGSIGFIVVDVINVALLFMFPAIVLWLPRLMYA